MKKLSNIEAGLKNALPKKCIYLINIHRYCEYYTVQLTLWNSPGIVKVELHGAQHIPYDGIFPFSYDNFKTWFQNTEYIRENLF